MKQAGQMAFWREPNKSVQFFNEHTDTHVTKYYEPVKQKECRTIIIHGQVKHVTVPKTHDKQWEKTVIGSSENKKICNTATDMWNKKNKYSALIVVNSRFRRELYIMCKCIVFF